MSNFALDANAQPVSRRLNASRNLTRDTQELIGICRGIVFDGSVVQAEAERLLAWIDSTPSLINSWPANVIYERLRDVLSDGFLDQNEARDVLALLGDIVGAADKQLELNQHSGELSSSVCSTKQPLDEITELCIKGAKVAPTGKFSGLSRRELGAIIESHGGVLQSRPNQETNYVVVGSLGSRDWITSSAGRKIEHAIKLRDSGCGVKIIAEEVFLSFLIEEV